MKVSKYYCDCCGEEIPSPKWKTVEITESNNFTAEVMLCENCWYKKIRPLIKNNFKQENNKTNEWHNLKELPNKKEDVLLCCRGVCGKRVYSIGYWTGKTFVCINGENDILAWKELPELPKESE